MTERPEAEAGGDDPAEWFFVPEEGPGDPRPIMRRLVDAMPEFADLKAGEAVIMVLMRRLYVAKGGKGVLGSMALPVWQGRMGPLAVWLLAKSAGGAVPDFIMTLDATWWSLASNHQREALVFHELLHAMHATDREGELRFTEEGLPIWAIRPHDIEEFNAVVRRYGAWETDVALFAQALREGGVV